MANEERADAVKFSSLLRREMRRAGVTATELARRSEISPTTIARWYAGLNVPRNSSREKIAAALDINVDKLL